MPQADGQTQGKGLYPVQASRDVPAQAIPHGIFAQWWHDETMEIARKEATILRHPGAARSRALKRG